MSTVKADTVQPKDFEGDLTLGASGDTVTVAANSINVNKVQDKGGNTLWDYSTGEFVSPQPTFASQNLKLLNVATFAGVDSVAFASDIDSSHDVYIWKFININPATNSSLLRFQVNAVGQTGWNETITSSFFRAYHAEADNSSGVSYQDSFGLHNSTGYCTITRDTGNQADECCTGELYLFKPSDTTYVKQFYSTFVTNTSDDQVHNTFVGGYINTTAAINQINFRMDNSSLYDGIIKMYGLLG